MKKVFFGAALLLALSGVVLSIPEVKTVERSAVMPDVPPAAVHAVLHDLRTWNGWLPAKERLPESSTYEGDGAVWRWKVKDGRSFGLRRTSSAPERLEYEFLDGAAVTQTILLAPEGTGTRVTWRHSITLRGIPKLAPLWLSPEKVVGPILEEELAALGKRVAPP